MQGQLQRGLIVGDKAERVANYQRNMMRELNVIAHSCGVPNARHLMRKHARVVQSPRASISLVDYYRRSR